METKEYYDQIPRGRDYINNTRQQIALRREMMKHPSSTPFDREWTTGSKSLESPQERELRRIIADEAFLEKYIQRFQLLLIEADILLEKVSDMKIQTAMREFYINGTPLRKVERMYDRNERTIYRWFNTGFAEIPLPSHPISLNELCEKCQ